MEIKDYLTGAALTISLVSLFLSWRSAGFSRRAKSVELRAELLARVSETALVTSRLRNARDEFLALAVAREDDEKVAQLVLPEIEENQNSIAAVYAALARASTRSALELYEHHFHTMGEICDRTRAHLERLTSMKAEYERTAARA